jgi:hypothetical protein
MMSEFSSLLSAKLSISSKLDGSNLECQAESDGVDERGTDSGCTCEDGEPTLNTVLSLPPLGNGDHSSISLSWKNFCPSSSV